jgi:N-acyl homoserine lactone hydrolase
MNVDILLSGFPGTSDRGTLGWSTVAAVATAKGTMVVDTGSFGDRAVLLESIKRKKIDRLQVATLFISHLHYDHCLNADLFPNARVIVGAKEWEYAHSDEPERKGDTFVPKCFLPYIASRNPVLVEEGRELDDGIRVIELPGHTPGCIGLWLEKDKLVIAADALKNAHDLFFRDPGMCFDSRETSVATIDKIAAMAARILPGHDSLLTIENGKIKRQHQPRVAVSHFVEWQAPKGRCVVLPEE